MKVYLAAPWTCKGQAKAFAQNLRIAGFELTSRWYDVHKDSTDAQVLADEALTDLIDIDRADAIVVLNYEKSEGKAVETGYALGKGKAVVVYSPGGERLNIFQYLPNVRFVHTLSGVVEALRSVTCLT